MTVSRRRMPPSVGVRRRERAVTAPARPFERGRRRAAGQSGARVRRDSPEPARAPGERGRAALGPQGQEGGDDEIAEKGDTPATLFVHGYLLVSGVRFSVAEYRSPRLLLPCRRNVVEEAGWRRGDRPEGKLRRISGRRLRAAAVTGAWGSGECESESGVEAPGVVLEGGLAGRETLQEPENQGRKAPAPGWGLGRRVDNPQPHSGEVGPQSRFAPEESAEEGLRHGMAGYARAGLGGRRSGGGGSPCARRRGSFRRPVSRLASHRRVGESRDQASPSPNRAWKRRA
jgi:hypothetical protein